MTTIAIERELLVRIEKELFLARNYGGTLRDEPLLKKVSTVLALAELERLKSEFDSIIEAIGDDPAPATAPDELERLKTESEERLQNCAALVAENEQLRKDAERYQWLAEYLVSDDESYDDAIVAATTVAELDYVTDAAMKGIEIEPGVFSGCDQSGGDCPRCGALAWSGCSVCKPATAPDEQVRRDAERVTWYENNPEKVLNIGVRWYSRNGYGLPMKRRKGFREAIDAAMKETP